MSDIVSGNMIRIRQCRGLILDTLNSVYPGSLPDDLLRDTMLSLDQPVIDDYVSRDLAYLKGRGLVTDEIQPIPGQRRVGREVRWSLTADGVTFIERGKPWADMERIG